MFLLVLPSGVPLFISHLVLDLPIMRGSAGYNWRPNPLIKRGKDGVIKRSNVTYTIPDFFFYDYPDINSSP